MRHRDEDPDATAVAEEEILFPLKRPCTKGLVLTVKPSCLAPGLATRLMGAIATGPWDAQPDDLRRFELPPDLKNTNLWEPSARSVLISMILLTRARSASCKASETRGGSRCASAMPGARSPAPAGRFPSDWTSSSHASGHCSEVRLLLREAFLSQDEHVMVLDQRGRWYVRSGPI
jgi:hypothetical protein